MKYGKLLCNKSLGLHGLESFTKGKLYQIDYVFPEKFKITIWDNSNRSHVCIKGSWLDHFSKDVILNSSYGRIRSLFIKDLL